MPSRNIGALYGRPGPARISIRRTGARQRYVLRERSLRLAVQRPRGNRPRRPRGSPRVSGPTAWILGSAAQYPRDVTGGAPLLQTGQVLSGEFRVIRQLGAGGMGAVYVAEQLSTGKERALKVMHPQLLPDQTSRQRFREEALVASRIPSDHVVDVIAAGVDDATQVPWIAMELLEGMSLDAVVDTQAPLPRKVVIEIFVQLGHALAAAHAKGIVHRDLKPENIFVAKSRRSDATLTLKVLDFGIAKSVAGANAAATVTTAIGSPLWMAPEQGTPGARLSPSTDVWALGLLAFYLLTECYYWASANHGEASVQALLVEVMVSPLEPPTQRAAALGRADRIPPGFDAWFAKCVARQPNERFADARAAVTALQEILRAAPASQPIASTVALAPGAAAQASMSGRSVAPTVAMASSSPITHGAPVRRPAPVGLVAALVTAGLVIAGLIAVLVIVLSRDDGAPVTDSTPTSVLLPQPVVTPEPTPTEEPTLAPPEEPTADSEPEPAPVRSTEAPVTRPEQPVPDERDTIPDEDPAVPPPEDRCSDPHAPPMPGREDVIRAMNSIYPSVAACGGGSHGLLPVQITFDCHGGVASTNVAGTFPDDVRSCAARAARQARVPPFTNPTFRVNYPFRL
ncbi:MAG: serine/threonine protein kinase [Sandaracinaceae bacterium]